MTSLTLSNCRNKRQVSVCVFVHYVDRELTTTKRKMETDVSSQRSVIEESKNRITMLENILAKEAVTCQHFFTLSTFH